MLMYLSSSRDNVDEEVLYCVLLFEVGSLQIIRTSELRHESIVVPLRHNVCDVFCQNCHRDVLST